MFIIASQALLPSQYSYNGIYWFNNTASIDTLFLAYSQTIVPDIATQNLNIYSQKQPTYIGSTNQILATTSSIVLNNTVYINKNTNNVGINNPNPQYELDILGSIQLSTDVARKTTTSTWTVTSDERIKTDIEDANVDICYSNIRDFKLRRYTYISSFINETQLKDKHRLGVIAQEVGTIIPKLVETSQGYGFNDLQTVNIDQLNWAHYGATKKLMQKVEDQEAKISTLMSANESLFSQMSPLLKNNI
jgi:hypothetical protein